MVGLRGVDVINKEWRNNNSPTHSRKWLGQIFSYIMLLSFNFLILEQM